MQVIKLGFVIKNEILQLGTIQPGGSGTYQGKEYPASVKFRSENIVEDVFEGTIKEIPQLIEYKVRCSSNQEAALVTELLRKSRTANIPVYVNTAIPKLYEGSQFYLGDSIENGHDFININQSVKDVKKV
jgi:hypothetical protein